MLLIFANAPRFALKVSNVLIFGILEDLGVAIQNDNGINNFFDPYEQQISNTNNANF